METTYIWGTWSLLPGNDIKKVPLCLCTQWICIWRREVHSFLTAAWVPELVLIFRTEKSLNPARIQTLDGLICSFVSITKSYPDYHVFTGLTETQDLPAKPTYNTVRVEIWSWLDRYHHTRIFKQHMAVPQPQECNLLSATYGACTATLTEAHYEQQTMEHTVLLLMWKSSWLEIPSQYCCGFPQKSQVSHKTFKVASLLELLHQRLINLH